MLLKSNKLCQANTYTHTFDLIIFGYSNALNVIKNKFK